MKLKKLLNPFPVTGYQGSDYFCNREKESSKLISNIKSGLSTTLISIRRIGKTGLIQHVFSKLPEGYKGIYLDILETENINHFLNHFGTALLRAESENTGTGRKIWNFLKSARPVITFDMLTGAPQATFDLKPKEAERSIESILSFLDHQSFKVIIAIDEFQQITNYPEKNTDAWFRARIQQLKNTVFIFSGRQQHIMSELFSSPKRPFFRSTSLLKLEKLEFNIYRDFIMDLFRRYKKEISREITEDILVWGDRYTFYIQQICNRVFAATEKQVTDELWKNQVFELLKEQEIVFIGYRNLLTKNQWQLLKAIAKDGKVFQPTGKEFLSRHGLINSASVIRSLRSLLKSELVFTEYDTAGIQYYSVYDVFFQKWCIEK